MFADFVFPKVIYYLIHLWVQMPSFRQSPIKFWLYHNVVQALNEFKSLTIFELWSKNLVAKSKLRPFLLLTFNNCQLLHVLRKQTKVLRPNYLLKYFISCLQNNFILTLMIKDFLLKLGVIEQVDSCLLFDLINNLKSCVIIKYLDFSVFKILQGLKFIFPLLLIIFFIIFAWWYFLTLSFIYFFLFFLSLFTSSTVCTMVFSSSIIKCCALLFFLICDLIVIILLYCFYTSFRNHKIRFLYRSFIAIQLLKLLKSGDLRRNLLNFCIADS
jgi:hypothetical protein